MIQFKHRIVAIIVLLLGLFMLSQHAKAQNVILQGNTFVQQTTNTSDSTRTEYYYQDRSGNKYPVYLSAKGKAYAWVMSKPKYDEKGNLLKPAHMYKKYLPKITEALNGQSNRRSH